MNQEFEWMIVNDGSDDNTDSLVSAWMKEAPPVSNPLYKNGKRGKAPGGQPGGFTDTYAMDLYR